VRLRNSYDPVGRYWLSSVEVRVAFRERSFTNLPQIGHMLETSLLGAKKKREAGGSVSGNRVEEGMEVEPTEQSRSLTTSLLAQALVAATAGKQAPAGLLALWRENSKGLAGYQWMDAWIGIAEKVFAASVSEAVMTMVSEASTAEVRMLAATRVMSDADCSVDARFNAHVWIVCWVAGYEWPWRHELGLQLASFIAEMWMNEVRNRFRLRNPKITVPGIERACQGSAVGIAKAASILLVAADAVTIRLSGEVAGQLQSVASQSVTDPYRFA
jgi:hypothetical protein